ncbi:hypothetical protein FSP39_010727 [Pinctada imbricata]|uniref:m7GpppN-mRNA hydrolase NUDT17 n=1 Tax=Pinctada imbricata TaxID=66713 RepID=A0AA88YA95_PINIB|nr:hypothetical protein FSP39_010727 [Pinctada imbricata]
MLLPEKGSLNKLAVMRDIMLCSRALGDSGNYFLKMKRPSFCPITNLSPDDIEQLPSEIGNRGIDVGAAVILESSDNKILLTRRSKGLRTFPNVWVPPGGHIEQDESFVEAGLRELREETGLDIRPHQCVSSDLNVLALWESVYPPKLNMGLPRRHHIVVYLHGKLTSDLTSDWLNTKMKLEPSEADACAWVHRDLVKAIVSAKEEVGNTVSTSDMPESIRGLSVDESGVQKECDIALEPLLRVCGVTSQVERVSTGTKYALEEWLQLT